MYLVKLSSSYKVYPCHDRLVPVNRSVTGTRTAGAVWRVLKIKGGFSPLELAVVLLAPVAIVSPASGCFSSSRSTSANAEGGEPKKKGASSFTFFFYTLTPLFLPPTSLPIFKRAHRSIYLAGTAASHHAESTPRVSRVSVAGPLPLPSPHLSRSLSHRPERGPSLNPAIARPLCLTSGPPRPSRNDTLPSAAFPAGLALAFLDPFRRRHPFPRRRESRSPRRLAGIPQGLFPPETRPLDESSLYSLAVVPPAAPVPVEAEAETETETEPAGRHGAEIS